MQALRGTVVTMDPDRRVLADGMVVFDGETIAAVGPAAEAAPAHPGVPVSGRPDDLITPGYLNGHQHLTGDRLIHSTIPDRLPAARAIFDWVVPVHGAHGPDDDELAATLTLADSLSNGITSTWEAGTVAHPDRVAAAAAAVGARVTLGTWGWDAPGVPYAGTVDEVIDRQRQVLGLADGSRIGAWVSLVGHDLMSDELVVAASALAHETDTGLTFHLSPTTDDADAYLARTGVRPLVHLDRLGVIDARVAVAHAVHLDDAEVEVLLDRGAAVVSCPWAYLRLGQGASAELRHLVLWRRGGRLALGCDAENAGDMVDGLRAAALFAGLAKDVSVDAAVFGAHDALELLTIRGAEALGASDRLGSLEVGKQADLVVHDRGRVNWIPPSDDPVLQLIWGTDGRSVRDVYVAGSRVVADGRVVGIDLDELRLEAARARRSLLDRAAISPDQ